MRISRTLQLYVLAATVHLMWRCHNKEYYLRSFAAKALYMQAVCESLKKNKHVHIYSFCVMDNHYHQSTGYEESSQTLSSYMRYAHSLFGSRFNKVNKRSGKVAESRPKTSLIEDEEHEIRVQFYIEANPIRANLCSAENLKNYKYNSFKFYAYGLKDEYTGLLTVPEWYMKLGKTAKERQRKYRKLFYAYLAEQTKPEWKSNKFESAFIGSSYWEAFQKQRISSFVKLNTS